MCDFFAAFSKKRKIENVIAPVWVFCFCTLACLVFSFLCRQNKIKPGKKLVASTSGFFTLHSLFGCTLFVATSYANSDNMLETH